MHDGFRTPVSWWDQSDHFCRTHAQEDHNWQQHHVWALTMNDSSFLPLLPHLPSAQLHGLLLVSLLRALLSCLCTFAHVFLLPKCLSTPPLPTPCPTHTCPHLLSLKPPWVSHLPSILPAVPPTLSNLSLLWSPIVHLFFLLYLQLTLEQYRFELHRSTYMQFFPNKYVLPYYTIWLVESADTEPRIQRAHCKAVHRFLTAGGRWPLTPALFKDQLHSLYYNCVCRRLAPLHV